jgi:hypothetical protein
VAYAAWRNVLYWPAQLCLLSLHWWSLLPYAFCMHFDAVSAIRLQDRQWKYCASSMNCQGLCYYHLLYIFVSIETFQRSRSDTYTQHDINYENTISNSLSLSLYIYIYVYIYIYICIHTCTCSYKQNHQHLTVLLKVRILASSFDGPPSCFDCKGKIINFFLD